MEAKEQMGMNFDIIRNREFKTILIASTILLAITLGLSTLNSKSLHNIFIPHSINIALHCLCFIGFIILIYLTMNSHYKKIKEITLEVEQMSRGSFGKLTENQKVGDVDILEFQLYQLSKRLQAQQEQVSNNSKLIKSTVSGLSHQLKTPVAVIRTFNDLLLEGALDEKAVAEEFIEKSSEQIDKLERLIYMFLKLSRLEAGVALINKASNNVCETIEKIVQALSEKALTKKIQLGFDNNNTIFGFYDAEWLYEAVYNIVDNAVKYTPFDGVINISVKKSETHVKIVVEDNGIGIEKDELPKIFDIFYQGEKAKRYNVSSTGIGLALTKLIIEKHAGVIKVDSYTGIGTKFTILLPN